MNFNLKLIKQIGIGIVSLVALYFLILLATRKPQLPVEVQAKLDSLTQVTLQLRADQVKYDSIVESQERVVEELNTQIHSTKEKITIIKEYYHEQSQAVSKYTPTQVDSFFKSRYGY